MSGTLTIKPVSAKLTRDTDLISKMDPYIIINIGSQRFQSQVCNSGGKYPIWSDVFQCDILNEEILNIEVWDKDTLSSDDLIGEGVQLLKDIKQNPQKPTILQIKIAYKGKSAGDVQIEFLFKPNMIPNVSMNQPNQMMQNSQFQNGQYPQQPIYPQQQVQFQPQKLQHSNSFQQTMQHIVQNSIQNTQPYTIPMAQNTFPMMPNNNAFGSTQPGIYQSTNLMGGYTEQQPINNFNNNFNQSQTLYTSQAPINNFGQSQQLYQSQFNPNYQVPQQQQMYPQFPQQQFYPQQSQQMYPQQPQNQLNPQYYPNNQPFGNQQQPYNMMGGSIPFQQ